MASFKAIELEKDSIRKLLLKYSLPGIIAMIVSSLYNLADSVFIGHGCGPLALAGLTVAKPFMDICAAFGSLVGVGASTIVAIKLGEKNYKDANLVLGNVILLNIILSSLVSCVGLIWLEPILYAFGGSESTIKYAYEYMQILLIGNVLTHIYFGLNNMLRSIGHPKISMIATIVSVAINVILDPIFIFTFNLGVKGAAIATIISQLIAVLWQLKVLCNPKEVVHFNKEIWKLNKSLLRQIITIGLAPFLMNLAHCLVVIIINNQLKVFGGDIAIASYGIINRFTFIFAMIVMGLNQGMQPIVGYNYGAQKYKRMMRAFDLTAICATIITSLLFLIGVFFPNWIIQIFTHEAYLINFSKTPTQIICCSMLIVGFQMVTINFFTSIGMPKKSIFLSLTRQVLYLIPLILLLPHLFKNNPLLGVWWSIPISDILSAFTAFFMLLKQKLFFKQEITLQAQNTNA